MTRRREFIRRAMAVGFGLPSTFALLDACSQKEETPSGKPVRLGALVPLTGVAEILGLQMRNNAVLAVEEINTAGGVLGQPVTLLVEDTETNPVAAVEKARKLSRVDRVDALVGTLTSAERWAIARSVSAPERMPYINSTYYEGGICVPYFFNTGALPNQQIDRFVPWLMEQKKVRTFFLGGSDYSWPRGTFRAVKTVVERSGGRIVGEDYSPLGSLDFSRPLALIAAGKPDVVFPLYAGEDGTTFFRQFLDRGLANRSVVASTALHETVVAGLPTGATEDWYCSAAYFMALDSPENKAFIGRYRARFGQGAILDAIGLSMFIAVQLFAKAVAMAKSTERDALAAAIQAARFQSPSGPVRMDKDTRCAYVNNYIARILPQKELPPEERFRIVATFEDVRPQQQCLDGPLG